MPVLHGDDRVERLGEGEAAERLTVGDDIGVARHRRVLFGAVRRAEPDEFGRLVRIDLARRPDRARQDARPVTTAHDEIGDLLPRLDAGERQQLAGMARGVAGAVGFRAAGVGERGRDRLWHHRRGRGGDEQGGKSKRGNESHRVSPVFAAAHITFRKRT